ncbi:hypothetical protein [Thermosipho sp. (in: thermotogales)]|jgi:predicted transcriptional regulator|uniref:hypothetical protein n=1 Tax=Thermosipho sp. (in: thermotogales) TaxID=1968895 RepID=UPI00257FCFFC|nr:hypothetical protein [Thermosipho sp. (in: thermotogales)]MBZ4649216.1 hypothetical protein [Thermosipho sp. (in: thermotogales)]
MNIKEIKALINDKFVYHKRQNQYYRLGCITKEECDGYDKFIQDMEELKRFIDEKIQYAKELETHHCEFNEDSYCIYCGLDGRA